MEETMRVVVSVETALEDEGDGDDGVIGAC